MERMVKGLHKVVNHLVLILLVAAALLALFLVADSDRYFSSAAHEEYAAFDPGSNDTGFRQLQSKNPDVFAWLELYGTAINFPVAQHPEDNSYYINHDATGASSSTGSIFLDVYSSKDFTDFNSLVYGHYMEEHAMFGDVKLFQNTDFFKTHEYGRLYASGRTYGLQTLAFLKVSAADDLVYTPHIANEQKAAYLSHLSDFTLLQREEPTTSDRLLLLSSCADDVSGGRFVLLCRLLEEVPENPFGESGESPTRQKILKRLEELSGVKLAGILLVLIILTGAVYRYSTRRRGPETTA